MLLVDTADQELIAEALTWPAVRGVTTNPTLIARAAGAESVSKADYVAQVRDLCRFWGASGIVDGHVMIQAIGSVDETCHQASLYQEDLAKARTETRLWIKLPPTPQGLQCCPRLQEMGCQTLVTAVYTAAQALVAVESGADGIAVYLGRLMRLEPEWEKQLERIAIVMENADKLLLMASFPDLKTVECALDYSHDLTVPPNVLRELLASPHSADALATFDSKIVG